MSQKARSKIIALPSDFGKDQLGLEDRMYTELAENITHLLHLAWSVNFNKALESFEADCIAGARNLMCLCLAAGRPQPASFNFCSSVSATAATPGDVIPEALPESLTYAQNMGYAQSKLVTEHLCDRASQQSGLTARVLRVGQIIGDTQFGVWNDTEAIPMIFQSAKSTHALPTLDERPFWLPVDVVARACVEIACSAATSGVMNIVNENDFHWTKHLLPLLHASGLEFEAVPQQEWVRRLRASSQDPSENPPIKLVDFFAGKYDNDKPRRFVRHATLKAQGYSPSLQNAGVVDATLINKIMAQLRMSWGVTQTSSAPPPAAIIVGGPCGSGKSTIARLLEEKLALPVIEGDDMHSRGAKDRMGNNVSLSDSDRMSWLAHIRGAVMDRLSSSKAPAIIVTCSALKRRYRDEIRSLEEIAGIRPVFLMLETASREELRTRLGERVDHYMQPAMVDAQVDALEVASADEIDVEPIDASRSVDVVAADCETFLREILGSD